MSDLEMVKICDDNGGFQTKDGQQLRIGDCVCLHPADPTAEYYIGEVQKLYRDKKGENWIRIRWYYRPQDLQHEPRSNPLKNEVYFTKYFDLQLLETVAKRCRVVTKSDYLKLNDEARRFSTEKPDQDDIYFYEYAYLAETGSFTRISDSDAHCPRAFKKQRNFDRENGVSLHDLVDALVQLENTLRKDAIPACWTDKRSEWILKVKESKTVQDITQSLLDLENGLQIILSSDGKTDSKSRSAWRKALTGNQNPNSLLQNIEHLRDYVLCRSNGALKKRKRVWTDHEDNCEHIILQKQEKEELPALQDFVSEDLDNGSEKYGASIKTGSFYAIEHKNLPPKAPIHLKSIRVVMVTEKTEVNISVKFPSNRSLRKHFGREFYEGDSKNASRQSPRPRQIMLTGTHPVLDEQFAMSPRLAKRVLAKPISCTEYVQQRQLESFWLVNSNTKRSPGADQAVETPMPINSVLNGSEDWPIASYVEADVVPIKWGVRRKVRFNRKHRSKNELQLAEDAEQSSPGIRRRGAPKRQRHRVEEDDASFNAPGGEKDKTSMLKLPRDMQGRWTSDRYRTAQLKLLDIMHEKKAAPGKPILRPALREEARKHIGDTGLLDHLLKHMTDTVITNGERFRRRHNAEGAMEYWLEPAELMEIRKQAGVEDPAWVPPPGWKPGDNLALNGYGRGMTPSEAEEMKMIREEIGKLNSQLRSLCSMKSTDNTEKKGDYGTSAENDGIFNEKLKDMRTEITTLRRDVEQIQSKSLEENNHLQLVNMEPVADDLKRLKMSSVDSQIEKTIQAASKMSRCSILERVNRLEADTQKFFQDMENNYRSLSAEKKHLKDQVADMSTNLEKMQEDMNKVLKFLAQMKESGATDPNSSPSLVAVGRLSELLTKISNPSSAVSSTEKAENGGRSGKSGEIPPFYKPAVYHDANGGPPEQHAGRTGFRVCKPEGTFIWPNMATMPCSRVQIEDVLSPRRSASSHDNTTAGSGSATVSNGVSPQQPEYSSPSKQTTTDRAMISKAATAVTKDFAATTSALTVYKSPSKAEMHNSHKDSANELQGTQLSLSPSVQIGQPRLMPQPCKRPADLVSMYVAHLTAPKLRWAQDLGGQIVRRPGPPTLPAPSRPAREMIGNQMAPLLLSHACNPKIPTSVCHVQAPEASGTVASPSSWLGLAPPASSALSDP